MAEKLTDDEIENLIGNMWAMTVDEHGVKHTGQTERGQFALDLLAKIVAAALALRFKPGEVISLDDHRNQSD